MDLFSDLIEAVQSDLSVDSTSSLFNPTAIKSAINRATRKACSMFKWPETMDAKKTSSVANLEYYEYPDNWKSMSIWKLVVDGVDYERPISFNDYLYEKENNLPSGNTKMWSNYGRRYYIYPTPTTNGVKNIEVHGQRIVDKMVNDADVTIFSYSMPEGNEAIVLEAVAILKAKGGDTPVMQVRIVSGALLLSIEAQQILSTAWGKIRQEMAKYEKTQPEFAIEDMFKTRTTKRSTSRIGNF